MNFLDQIRRRQSSESGPDLFEVTRENALAEPQKRAKTAIREAALTVARTWERLPAGWAKKAASRGISNDTVLLKAECKVSEQWARLSAIENPAGQKDDIELVLSRISEGARFWKDRAIQIMQSQKGGQR